MSVGPTRASRSHFTRYTPAAGTNLHTVANWREAYGNNWKELSDMCKRLANYTCNKCLAHYPPPYSGKLQAHHVIPLSSIGTSGNALWNLVCLCVNCHVATHRRR